MDKKSRIEKTLKGVCPFCALGKGGDKEKLILVVSTPGVGYQGPICPEHYDVLSRNTREEHAKSDKDNGEIPSPLFADRA